MGMAREHCPEAVELPSPRAEHPTAPPEPSFAPDDEDDEDDDEEQDFAFQAGPFVYSDDQLLRLIASRLSQPGGLALANELVRHKARGCPACGLNNATLTLACWRRCKRSSRLATSKH